MLELLRRAGFDVEARIAALKIELEAKAQHLSETIKRDVRIYAVAGGLLALAGIFVLLLLLVGLAALFVAVAEAHGTMMGFAIVGLSLMAMCLSCAIAAMVLVRRRPSRPYLLFPPPPLAAPVLPMAAMEGGHARAHPQTARSLFQDVAMPLVSLVSRYRPVTGHWGVDGVIRHAGSRTQATAKDAVMKAADLVEHGSRGTMVTVLTMAVTLGWLVTRRRQ